MQLLCSGFMLSGFVQHSAAQQSIHFQDAVVPILHVLDSLDVLHPEQLFYCRAHNKAVHACVQKRLSAWLWFSGAEDQVGSLKSSAQFPQFMHGM